MTPLTPGREQMPDEPPPVLGAWWRLYVAVLAYLACLITLFWVFTKVFS